MKKTIARINYLKDPESVDKLTDLFQEMGIPMGSDEWANIAVCKLRRLIEAENTLRLILNAVESAKSRDGQELWRMFQKKYEDQSSRRCQERDNYIPPGTPNTWTCKCGKPNPDIQTYCWDCREIKPDAST